MRCHVFAALAAVLFIPSASFAQPVEPAPGTVIEQEDYYQGRSASPGECDELRRACINKEELGEEGLGNCRRYRELCEPR